MSYNYIVGKSIHNILTNVLSGRYPLFVGGNAENTLFGEGISLNLGENKLKAHTPNTRNIVTVSPEASILIKKKAFSTFKANNDLRFMDKTERMLLRATKALFAYKCAQIRTYESLTKFESDFKSTHQVNLGLFVDLLNNAQFLEAEGTDLSAESGLSLITSAISNTLSDLAYDAYKGDVLKIVKRNAFSSDISLTTWMVDPESTDNYTTGPGTGVIDLCAFTSFSTTTDIQTNPSPASIVMEDPYRILTITDDEIELAIDEALNGTIGLLRNLTGGDPDAPLLDASSLVSAGLEQLGLGSLDGSLNIGYIRDRLRIFYLGKAIINPGDGVHFYIRGNKSVNDYRNEEGPSFEEDYLTIDSSILEAERILYTNQRIDLDTYTKLRRNADNSFSMAHVFGGFVTDVNESFSGGKWTLKANCIDNMGWLQWARFMIEPAMSDPQGVLEDPLTPYEIKTDDSGRVLSAGGPELLDENKALLQSGLLKYDAGLLNGQVATETNLLQGQYNDGGSLQGARVLQHPSGFIYRWKTGIITAIANLATIDDPLNEESVSSKRHRQAYGYPVTSTDSNALGVLNNLDIANILSILIVGQPYNVEGFIEQAYFANGYTGNSAGSLDPTNAVTSVLDITRRQNRYLGNFRPYRMITMSSQSLEAGTSGYIMRSNANASIEALRNRKIQLKKIKKDLVNPSNPNRVSITGGAEGALARSVQAEINDINRSIKAQVKPYADVSLDSSSLLLDNFNLFGNNRTLSLSGNFTADHQTTRALVLVGAQRRLEDARLNRDMNLFIVSDQYDENTDIRPYLFKLRDSSYKVFQGVYASVYEKCEAAAKFMNMEFFCNPQGHLEFRPPQWNKTPKSILERLYQIEEDGVVPAFLKDLFGNRTESLRREIHMLNMRIVIIALLLGKYPDKTLIPNLLLSGPDSLAFFGVSQDDLEGGGTALGVAQLKGFDFSIGDIQTLDDQTLGDGLSVDFSLGDEGDITNGDTSTLLGVFDAVFQESSANVFNNVLNTVGNRGGAPAKKVANPSNVNAIRSQFRKLNGGDPGADLAANSTFEDADFIFNLSDQTRAVGKVNYYLAKMSSTISERDKLVELLVRNEEKQQELEDLESALSGEFTAEDTEATGPLAGAEEFLTNASNTISTAKDIITGDSTKGNLLDHLVSDDSKNLKGPGSGRRFVIEDHDIITCTFNEMPPEFTRVDVVGNAPLLENLQQSFENTYYWAGATDFDMWRQYGYKPSKIDLPFASNADLQSRPFAIMELQIQRTKIQQASITVVGNEYYEPGDVVFVRGKGLLYYVTSVNHSFDFAGQSFTTQLTLNNGHPPGVYLPSPLDVIGQQLTKDPFDRQITTYRNSDGDDKYRELRPDCAILFPNNKEITTDNIDVLLDHQDNMVRFANMMIELNTLLLGNKKVLIRGFVKQRDDIHRSEVENNMNIIKELLQNPQMITQFETTGLSDSIDLSASNLLGLDTGSEKGLTSLVLPNGLQAAPVPADAIVQQVSILEGSAEFEIKCLDKEILASVDSPAYPKGGPKQKTWLDFRDDFTKLFKVVEVGIIDLTRGLEEDPGEGGIAIGGGEISASGLGN